MADKQTQKEYTSADLKHLSDRDHVRERPSMYIGDTTSRGLHHLVYEVVDNSIDECMAGHAKHVSVTVNVDGSAVASRSTATRSSRRRWSGTSPRSRA
jgi:DNA gyrase subunit B